MRFAAAVLAACGLATAEALMDGSWYPPEDGSWDPSENELCKAHADCPTGQYCTRENGRPSWYPASCGACLSHRYWKTPCLSFDRDCCSRQILGKCPASAGFFDCNRPCSRHGDCDCGTYCSTSRLCEACSGAPAAKTCDAVDGDCCAGEFLDRCPMPNVFADAATQRSSCPTEQQHSCEFALFAPSSPGYEVDFVVINGFNNGFHGDSDNDKVGDAMGVKYHLVYDQANARARLDLAPTIAGAVSDNSGTQWYTGTSNGTSGGSLLRAYDVRSASGQCQVKSRPQPLSAAAAADLLPQLLMGLLDMYEGVGAWNFALAPGASNNIQATSFHFDGTSSIAGVSLQSRRHNSCIVNDLLSGKTNLSATTPGDPRGFDRTMKVDPATCELVELEMVQYRRLHSIIDPLG
eukprot:COSAG05_NODE_2680_length_2775_cov_5.741779_2_plen_407_part_00